MRPPGKRKWRTECTGTFCHIRRKSGSQVHILICKLCSSLGGASQVDCFNSGGGTVPNVDMDLSAPSLRWMSYQATAAGLHVKPVQGKWKFEAPITIHESLAWYWWPFEMIPWVRLTYQDAQSWTMRSVPLFSWLLDVNFDLCYVFQSTPGSGTPYTRGPDDPQLSTTR